MPQSPDIRQNLERVISDFQISNQFFIKENCHNYRTSDDVHMELGPVTKLFKREKIPSKNLDDDVMSENCDVIAIFVIFGQFGPIWKVDSWHIDCKTYIIIKNNLLSYKNWKQN